MQKSLTFETWVAFLYPKLEKDQRKVDRVTNKIQHLANLGTVGVWFVASLPVCSWALNTLSHEQHQMNLMLLLMVTAAVLIRGRDFLASFSFLRKPQFSTLHISMVVGGLSIYLVGENILDIDIASACGFAIASIGLVGGYMPAVSWRRCIVPVLLLVGALPFQFHLEAYIGFPLRVAIDKDKTSNHERHHTQWDMNDFHPGLLPKT